MISLNILLGLRKVMCIRVRGLRLVFFGGGGELQKDPTSSLLG